MIEVFNSNKAGYVKRKEMQVYKLEAIKGLTAPDEGKSSTSCFDTLQGEKMIKTLQKMVQCEHNFKVNYLSKTHTKKGNNFFRNFSNLTGNWF